MIQDEKIDRIVQLDIEVDGLSEEELEEYGVDIVSLVEEPAIGVDFMAFSAVEEFISPQSGENEDEFINRCMGDAKMTAEYPDEDQRLAVCYNYYEGDVEIELETYNDYPKAASANACRALKWAEENGWGSCGTPVGKKRANQLCNRENISRDTIARMSAFRRQQKNKNTPYDEGCGKLVWDAWGGDEGIEWAARKLEQIDREEAKKAFNHQFAIDEDRRVVTGPLMIPNKFILRRDENGEPYYIFFKKETIRKMAEKFLKLGKQNNTDVQHDNQVTNKNTLLESWISEDKMYDKAYKMGFALPMGTWFVSYKINDDDTWNRVKNKELRGFSLAGPFIEKLSSEGLYNQTLSKIIDILKQVDE